MKSTVMDFGREPDVKHDTCKSEISDMINFTMYHQLLRSWVEKQLKLITKDEGFNKTCKCNVTVRNLK